MASLTCIVSNELLIQESLRLHRRLAGFCELLCYVFRVLAQMESFDSRLGAGWSWGC